MTNCNACNQPLPVIADRGAEPVVESQEDPASNFDMYYRANLTDRGELANRVLDALVNRK